MDSLETVFYEQTQLYYIILLSALAYVGWRWLLRSGFLKELIIDVISNALDVCLAFLSVYGLKLIASNSSISPDDIPSTTQELGKQSPVDPTAGPMVRAMKINSSTALITVLHGPRPMGRFTVYGRAQNPKCM